MEIWHARQAADVVPLLGQSDGIVPQGNFKRSAGFSGLRSLIAEKGGDADALLTRFGVEPALLDDSEAYLPYRAMGDLLAFCAETFDAPHFGFELGRRQSADVMGPLAVLLLSAPTVAEGLELVARHMKVHAPGARLELREGGETAHIFYEIRDPINAINRHLGEMSMATGFNTLTAIVGQEFRLEEVLISSAPPPARDPALERFFHAPVKYDRPICALGFARHFLDRRVDSCNPTLLRFARAQCETICPEEDRLGDLVATHVRQLMPMGSCTLDAVARQLSIHPRSLQNQLQASGHEFRDILKAQRQDMAQTYLARTQTPIADIAALLGYSDQSTFTRAFSSWFGTSPKRYRAAHRVKAL